MTTAKRTVEELNQLRKKAVIMRLNGSTIAATCEATGLSSPTIISAFNNFKAGGWDAVYTQKRGRKKSSDNNDSLKIQLLHEMLSSQPGSERLWSNDRVIEWLSTAHDQTFNRKTADRMTRDLGIESPSLASDTPAEQWFRDKHPDFDTQQLPTRTRYLKGTITRLQPAGQGWVIFAQDFRGKRYWQCTHSAPDSLAIVSFLKNLSEVITGRTVLSFNGADLSSYDDINNWLNQQSQLTLLTWQAKPIADHSTEEFNLKTKSYVRNTMALTHLQRLEAESIQIMREVVSKTENPVMLYSVGKDSAVMLHLAMKAFHPSKPPFPLLHVDTGWKFRDMYTFRDEHVKNLGLELITYMNPEGVKKGVNPFTHGSALHTDIMKTEGLKQALDKFKFDAAFGGARRDEEKSRAKERIFSFRTADHRWDPKSQRPELWKQYNATKRPGESIRVFPLSNWTELDIWQYIYLEQIPIVPLYYSAERPVVERDGTLIMVDDERMPLNPGEVPMMRKVRFRTLGCYPLTGAVESEADTLPAIIQEMLLTKTSERQGRVIDHDSAASMEKKKQEGYF